MDNPFYFRVVSTADDIRATSPSNGITLCVGSLASRLDNDVVAMTEEFLDKTHFVHLRNVTKTGDGGSFTEADHLDGDVDMFQVLGTLLAEKARREKEGGRSSETTI